MAVLLVLGAWALYASVGYSPLLIVPGVFVELCAWIVAFAGDQSSRDEDQDT
jgi:hypothetical protein